MLLDGRVLLTVALIDYNKLFVRWKVLSREGQLMSTNIFNNNKVNHISFRIKNEKLSLERLTWKGWPLSIKIKDSSGEAWNPRWSFICRINITT